MWKRGGEIYNGRSMVWNGVRYCNPPDSVLRAAGFVYVAPLPPTVDMAFAAVRAAFWGYVDEAAAALSEATGQTYTRADFPSGAYSPQLLAWCAAHGMDEAATGSLAIKFCGIAADLSRIGHNWNELFEGSGTPDQSEDEEVPDVD